MRAYLFDITLSGSTWVEADSEAEAKAMIAAALRRPLVSLCGVEGVEPIVLAAAVDGPAEIVETRDPDGSAEIFAKGAAA